MTAPALELATIPLTKLKPHPDNIRNAIPIDKGMVASIESEGILEPLLVLPADAKGVHLVVAGHRRRAHALKAKGVTEVPCIVRDLTPLQVVTTMMVENLQRADVDPFEEAAGYARMVELDATHASIAHDVGCSARHVKDRLALLQLPAAAVAFYRKPHGDGTLTLGGMVEALKYSADAEAMDAWTAELAKKRGRDWQATREPGRWISLWVSARDYQRSTEAALAKLEASGHPRYEPKAGAYFYVRDYLASLAKPEPVSALKLGGKAKAHEKEPCHALYVNGDRYRGKAELVPVCTSPKRHTTKARKADQSELQMDPKTYANMGTGSASGGKQGPAPKLKRAMTAARYAHAAATLANVKETGTASERLALDAMRGSAGEARDVAARLLGLSTAKGRGYELFDHFAADPDNTTTALVAISLATSIGRDWTSFRLAWPAWLRETGYEPVEGEAEWLDKDLAAYDREKTKEAKAVEARRAAAAKAAAAATSSAPAPEQLDTEPPA